MDNILNELNKEQLEAVLYNDGPLLILAGAGTGKTRVLTSKIAYILKNNLCYPSEILAVTFTNKAANEMKERVAKMLNFDISSMWINTFHSIAVRILRQHAELVGVDKNFTIIDQGEQTTLIKQILQDLDIDIKEYKPISYAEKISKFKENFGKVNNDFILPKITEVYELYQSRLSTLKLCDFGDLLLYNVRLFQENSDIKDYYNKKFKYILVDEYQDTNAIQHLWLKLISGVEKNDDVKITCVGDDDQSIYGWRGAQIENILTFSNEYKKAKILKLERNYRSTQNILSLASGLISHNKNRHGKTLFTDNKNFNDKVILIKANDGKQESFCIATKIQKLLKDKLIKSYNDIGILVRAGYQTRIFEDTFMKFAIPYKIIGALKFYDRKEIKDSISYLRLINNKFDILAFERALSSHKRGVGFTTIKKINDYSVENKLDIIQASRALFEEGTIKGTIKKELDIFLTLLEGWEDKSKDLSVSKLMETILDESGYMDSLKKDDDIESKNRIDNINEFVNILNDFKSIAEFLEYVNLVNTKDDNVKDSVNIMTMHSAKGLEFDCVFLPNWIESVFPSSKSLDETNGLEEERRLAYVAITRAKKYLFISYSKLKFEYGDMHEVNKSRFIDEMSQKNLEIEDLTFGDFENNKRSKKYVDYDEPKSTNVEKLQERKINTTPLQMKNVIKKCRHKTFGEGMIIKEDGNKATVIFKSCGEKVILKSFLDLSV